MSLTQIFMYLVPSPIKKRTKDAITAVEYIKKHCRDTLDTGSSLGNIKCCLESRIGYIPPTGVQCFPQVIIAGAQKTGTTVLSGMLKYFVLLFNSCMKCLDDFFLRSVILTKHPYINFALKKELHFFDIQKKMKFSAGVKGYISSFPPLYLDKGTRDVMYKKTFTQESLILPMISGWFSNVNKNSNPVIINSSSPKKLIVPLNVESSPFYIASDVACRNIASFIPNVRLIILLREPVSRLHSEYNMKKRFVRSINDKNWADFYDAYRRVDNQNEFLQALNGPGGNAAMFRDCLSVFYHEKRRVELSQLMNCMNKKADLEKSPEIKSNIKKLIQMVNFKKTVSNLAKLSSNPKENWLSACFSRRNIFMNQSADLDNHDEDALTLLSKQDKVQFGMASQMNSFQLHATNAINSKRNSYTPYIALDNFRKGDRNASLDKIGSRFCKLLQ